MTCGVRGMPLPLRVLAGTGNIAPQCSRQRRIYSSLLSICRSGKMFPHRRNRKAGIWTVSLKGNPMWEALLFRSPQHRKHAGGISDMRTTGRKILSAEILTQDARHGRNPVARSIPARRNAAVGCTSMAISTSSVFRRELRLRNRRRNSLGQPKENRSALLSWSLPLTSCHRRQRIKS